MAGNCPFLTAAAAIPGAPPVATPCMEEECELWDSVLEMCSMSATKAIISMGLEEFIPPPWYVEQGVEPDLSPLYSEYNRIDQSSSNVGRSSIGSSDYANYVSRVGSIQNVPKDLDARRAWAEENGYDFNEEDNGVYPRAPSLEILSEEDGMVKIKVTSESTDGPAVMKWQTDDDDIPWFPDPSIKSGDVITIPVDKKDSLKVGYVANT